jgi:hypothetical protein
MLRQSLIAAVVAVATITSAAGIASAQTQTGTHQRTVVHHAYTYEPAPNPYYYGPYYYGPSPCPASTGSLNVLGSGLASR